MASDDAVEHNSSLRNDVDGGKGLGSRGQHGDCFPPVKSNRYDNEVPRSPLKSQSRQRKSTRNQLNSDEDFDHQILRHRRKSDRSRRDFDQDEERGKIRRIMAWLFFCYKKPTD